MRSKWRTVALTLVASMAWSSAAHATTMQGKDAPLDQPKPQHIELKEFRTQHSKRFRNPDGSLTEEVYLSSIHYRDQNTGEWKDIDTNLIPSQDSSFGFTTKANRFTASIASSTGSPHLVKVKVGDKEVQLTPIGLQQVAAAVKANEASFNGVLGLTDLGYVFDPDMVKEFITLRAPAAARDHWNFQLNLQNLQAKEEASGGLSLVDDAGKHVFEIERPLVFDASGASTTGTLQTKRAADGLTVELSIDKSWLLSKARQYPVVIDPTISPAQDPFAGQDTFVGDASPSTNYSDRTSLMTGYDTSQGRGHTRTLISFNLPSLPSDASITNAALALTEWSGNQPATLVDLYRVTSDWSAGTVTWNTQPTVRSTKESTTNVTGAGTWSWDVTTLAQDWYLNKQPNLGVMLRLADETQTAKWYRSSRYTTTPTERAKLTITYSVDPLGHEAFWGYAGNMNVANGNMVMTAIDTAIPSRGLTAAITRTYNSRSTYDGPFGYGWTSEIDMRLKIPAMADGTPRGPIAYIDLDGTTHFFTQNPDGTYASPPGLYLTLVRNGDGTYQVTEKNGLVYKFATGGKVVSVTDANQNSITYTYSTTNPSQVTTITDAAGRQISLTWTGARVTAVSNQASTRTDYSYDPSTGNLIQVTVAANTANPYVVKYTYNAVHNLIALAPPANNKTYFFYDANNRLQSVNPINAVVNASFEVDGDGDHIPDYWSLLNSAGLDSVGTGIQSTPTPPFGTNSFAVSLISSGQVQNPYAVYQSTPIPVQSTIQYQLTGQVQATQTSGSQNTVLSLLAYDASGSLLGEYARVSQAGAIPFWSAFSFNVAANTLPSTTATVRVKVAASNTGGSGISYFDGIQLEEGAQPTSFSAPTTYTVDLINKAAAMYDGNGKKVKWTYNDSANPLTFTVDPGSTPKLNYQAQFTWVADKPNLIGSYKDPNAVKNNTAPTTYQYDANGNPHLVSDPLGNSAQYDYDLTINQLVKYTDPVEMKANPGSTTPQTSFTYDSQRNLSITSSRMGMASVQNHDLAACKGCLTGETPALSLADNLITNPSFEQSTSGTWPDGWTASGGTTGYVSSPAYSGGKAVSASPAPGGSRIDISHDADISATQGEVVTLSFYVQATSTDLAGGAQGRIEFFDQAHQPLSGTAYTNIVKVASTWNRSMITAVAPAGSVTARVILSASPGTATGSVYFDAVQLEKAAFMSAFNLAENPGFERGTTGPDAWISTGTPFTWSTSALSGFKSISVTNASQKSVFQPTNRTPYSSGTPLTLTAFVKTANLQNGNANIALLWYDNSGTYLGMTESSSPVSGTTNWTRLYVSTASAPPSGVAYVLPTLEVEASTGTVYFDAVRLELAQEVTAYMYGTSSSQPAYNNWMTEVDNPLGDKLQLEYDNSGSVTKVIPNGDQTHAVIYTVDGLERMTGVSLPNGLSASYSYNTNGMLSQQQHTWTDGTTQTATTTFSYNNRDLLTQSQDPLNRTTTYGYNAASNLTGVTTPAGKTIAFGYDAANRLTERKFTQHDYTFGYDPTGNVTSVGDGTRTWSYQYDSLNRLTGITNETQSTGYGYDANSRLVNKWTTVGQGAYNQLNFTYNEANQLQNVVDNSTTPGVEQVRLSYDERGRVYKSVAGNLLYSLVDYDGDGRLVRLQNFKSDGTFINGYAYAYDGFGNRVSETVTTGSGSTTTSYTYDSVGQLLSDGTYTYTYTPHGNRKTRTQGATTTYYCYDLADQLVYVGSSSSPCTATPDLSYDANGNLTHNASGTDVWDYAYDDENRQISAKKNGTTVAQFDYDFLGRRTQKISNGVTHTYHYDGFSTRVLYEIDNSGNVIWYNWVGDQLISQKRNGQFFYYQYNAHGDVIGQYDQNGNLVQAYTYNVWGTPTSSNPSDPNPFRYAGYWYDVETGLYYLNARFYDSNLGRFITSDNNGGILERPLSQNRYLYAANNGVRYADHSGHRPDEGFPEGYSLFSDISTSSIEPDYIVRPNGEVVPYRAYRYIGESALEEAQSGVIAPRPNGTYFSFNKYSSQIEAKEALQMTYTPKYRVEISGNHLPPDTQVPLEKWGNGPELEPYCCSYPEHGAGGGSQMVTFSPLHVHGGTFALEE